MLKELWNNLAALILHVEVIKLIADLMQTFYKG
jgi:hypothetical protein